MHRRLLRACALSSRAVELQQLPCPAVAARPGLGHLGLSALDPAVQDGHTLLVRQPALRLLLESSTTARCGFAHGNMTRAGRCRIGGSKGTAQASLLLLRMGAMRIWRARTCGNFGDPSPVLTKVGHSYYSFVAGSFLHQE